MATAEEDPLESIEKHLWTAKEFLKRKFGKKQDEYIAASDSQLDAKLEYFKSLRETSGEMMAALRAYHNIMYDLSQKERDLSALLRSRTNLTKCEELQASMSSVGKALRDSSQDRLEMRKHFSRLADEVTTFRKCAVTDCEESVQKMEAQRTQYRGALSWMRDVSNNLNPDSTMNMFKYRRVQDRVKETKKIFDNEKITSLEKIDLLAISRQGMFSQTLGGYIKAIKFYHKHMAALYGQLELEVKVPTTMKFETLKELNDLMPELPLPSAATIASSSGTAGDVALISIDEDAENLDNNLLLTDEGKNSNTNSDKNRKESLATHADNVLIDTNELFSSTTDEDSAAANRKSTTSSSELVFGDAGGNADLIGLTADDLLMLGDADDQNDDIFTGLDDSEVQALKDVFALSAPAKTSGKGDDNGIAAAEHFSGTMQNSSAYRRIPHGRNALADKSNAFGQSLLSTSSSKAASKKSDTIHGFLSFMPSLLQEAATAAMSSGTTTTSKTAAAKKPNVNSQIAKSSKAVSDESAPKLKTEGKPLDTLDDKAGLNSWFKLLEHVNLFEDEAECLLPQDGRRSSLGTSSSTQGDNSTSAAPSSTGTPVRALQETDPPEAGNSASHVAQESDAKCLSSGDQQQSVPKPTSRAQYWLADDSAA